MTKKIILSQILLNGEILETVYDPHVQETQLVISDGKLIETTDKYENSGIEWYPYPSDNELIRKGFVKLASAAGGYEGPTKIFKEIKDFINKYMKLSDSFLNVTATYVMMTWVYDRFHTIPYLRVIGDYGTGKTRFIQTMGNLCYKAIMAGGSTTTASLFRTIDQIQGTFVYDEADFRGSEMFDGMVKILNSGHAKGSPVLRMEANKDGTMTTRSFDVFGPKVLASRERFSDGALESRCLTQQLMPSKKTERPVHLGTEFESESLKLRNKLLSFRFDMYSKVRPDESTLGDVEFPRLRQAALAITTIAAMVGNDILEEIKNFLINYEKQLQLEQKREVKADVLLCILNIVKNRSSKVLTDKIYMKDVADQFDRDNYGDYNERKNTTYERHDGTPVVYNANYIISPKKIGGYIRSLGIRTDRDGKGFYIPYPQEKEILEVLAQRYGFDNSDLEIQSEPVTTPREITPEDLDIDPDDINF